MIFGGIRKAAAIVLRSSLGTSTCTGKTSGSDSSELIHACTSTAPNRT